MRIVLALVGLLALPTVCYAHSGTVAKTVANYLPMLLAFVPIFLAVVSKHVKSFFVKVKRLFRAK